jgi:hypothetical protein
MLDLQHQYNNCTITPHMRVDLTHWGPPSCVGLLCSYCDGIVKESNPGWQNSCYPLAKVAWLYNPPLGHGNSTTPCRGMTSARVRETT